MLFRILVLFLCVTIISGCGREEPKKKKIPASTVPAKKAVTAPKLTPSDSKDDPNFALLFPESNKVGGWIKTTPVAGGGKDKLADILPDLAEIFKPFGIENVSSAGYQRMYRLKVESAKVVIIRAKTSDDAYGLLSVSCPSADMVKFGETTRQIKPNKIFAVKGAYFAIFQADGKGDKKHLAKGLDLLAGKVMFEIADQGGTPMVVEILQTEDLPRAMTLFLRNISSMAGPAGNEILQAIGLKNPEAMNRLLELGPDVDFAVAAYKNDEKWIGPDVIWVAKYPSADKAMRVYRKYWDILKKASPESKLNNNTMIKAPRGRFLYGCWTMEAESLAHLMGKVRKNLP